MERPEILRTVDSEKIHRWLRSVRLPLLVELSFFEDMRFPGCFVRKYLKKQKKVLLPNGIIQRGVRGVSEVDFLWGLADEIGADTSAPGRALSRWARTRLCAEACIKVLDQIESEAQATGEMADESFDSRTKVVQSAKSW